MLLSELITERVAGVDTGCVRMNAVARWVSVSMSSLIISAEDLFSWVDDGVGSMISFLVGSVSLHLTLDTK